MPKKRRRRQRGLPPRSQGWRPPAAPPSPATPLPTEVPGYFRAPAGVAEADLLEGEAVAGHAPARRPGIRPVAPPEPKRFTPDYNYVASELRRIALFLGGILVVLVVLAIFLR